MEDDQDQRTIWCGNLSQQVTEEILYELFLQIDPLERVNVPRDRDGKPNGYGFVTFKHVESVNYAIDMFNGTALFDKRVNLKPRVKNNDNRNGNNMYNRNHGVVPQPFIDPLQNTDFLMQMGSRLLLDHKSPVNYNDANFHRFNQDLQIASTPQRRNNDQGYRDDYRNTNTDNNRSYRRSRYNHNSRQHSNPYNKGYPKNQRHSR